MLHCGTSPDVTVMPPIVLEARLTSHAFDCGCVRHYRDPVGRGNSLAGDPAEAGAETGPDTGARPRSGSYVYSPCATQVQSARYQDYGKKSLMFSFELNLATIGSSGRSTCT